MPQTAFIYPGQGSQMIGMGITVADHFPEATSVFDCASDLAGYDMYSLCAEGPLEKLSRTSYTQPALYTVEAAITDVLKARSITPDCSAGHSLGEFSAWYAAGVYSFEDGFRLISERARIMESIDPDGRGTMCAVIGLSQDVVEDICSSVEGIVVVANINSPLQIVISGEKSAVEKVEKVLKEKGARRVIPLKVSGAFHSPLIGKAREEFAKVVESVAVCDAEIPVYANISAVQVTRAEAICNAMIDQLTSTVRWSETVENMLRAGITMAYEIGPGNVLSGLIKRIDDTLAVRSISDFSQILEVMHEKARG